MIVANLTQQTILARQADRADTFFSRMQGLLGRTALSQGQALVITRCRSIHMFFMRFPIDVVFIDINGRVAGLVKTIQPWHCSPFFWNACQAIELPSGTIDLTKTAFGDTIQII